MTSGTHWVGAGTVEIHSPIILETRPLRSGVGKAGSEARRGSVPWRLNLGLSWLVDALPRLLPPPPWGSSASLLFL